MNRPIENLRRLADESPVIDRGKCANLLLAPDLNGFAMVPVALENPRHLLTIRGEISDPIIGEQRDPILRQQPGAHERDQGIQCLERSLMNPMSHQDQEGT